MADSPQGPPHVKNSSNSSSSSSSGEEERAIVAGKEAGSAPPPSAWTVQARPSSSRPKKRHDVDLESESEAAKGKKVEKGREGAMTVGVVGDDKGKQKKSESGALANVPERARTCSICRREFATARALFGHMRSHPEREWRGAHPPPVSPRREVEAEREQEAERVRQAEELSHSLLKIGQNILKSTRYMEKEEDQATAHAGGSSSAAMVAAEACEGVGAEKQKERGKEKAGEASGVVRGRPSSSSSSGETAERKKSKNKKKKTTTRGHDNVEEERRKQIHLGLDLNKDAPAEDKDEETPDASE